MNECDMPLTAPQVLDVLELLGPQEVERIQETFRGVLTEEEVGEALDYLIATGLLVLWETREGGYQILFRSPRLLSKHLRHRFEQ